VLLPVLTADRWLNGVSWSGPDICRHHPQVSAKAFLADTNVDGTGHNRLRSDSWTRIDAYTSIDLMQMTRRRQMQTSA
jgi:hypothetical protein